MRKNKFKIPDAMKMNGGFDLSDLELARLQLQETQMKLSGHYIPPEERGDMMSLEDAKAQLQETLSGNGKKQEPLDNEVEAELEKLKMKLNSKQTLKEARANLKRTQALL
ncbi:MAG: hypothetical protein M0Q47_00440 [Methanothrix sp.]|jgi:hypothetical protein|uniref:hypothetical protein n=1 Tax=Methanothrix sp. TaxID=90426 RepID=UPI0025D6C6DA|nr:hypothetical protein [Methanothrix sp.]MCK9404870.1 hypothetical protein [Methanothrix sp.]